MTRIKVYFFPTVSHKKKKLIINQVPRYYFIKKIKVNSVRPFKNFFTSVTKIEL